MDKRLARFFSRLLDPVWEIPVSLLLAIAFAVREGLRWRFVGLLLFIDVVVPTVFFLTMLYNKQIKDWDVRQRKQRIPLYLFTLLCQLGGLWLTHELGKGELVSILLIYYVTAVVFFLITLFWKISLHAGVNAVLITSLNIFYDWKYSWLYLFLLAVMWARVRERHHTWAQVLVGAALGGGMVTLGFALSSWGLLGSGAAL